MLLTSQEGVLIERTTLRGCSWQDLSGASLPFVSRFWVSVYFRYCFWARECKLSMIPSTPSTRAQSRDIQILTQMHSDLSLQTNHWELCILAISVFEFFAVLVPILKGHL